MHKNNKTISLGIISGVMLTIMITLNSCLSTWSSPLLAAWIAHGSGTIFSLLLLFVMQAKPQQSLRNKAPIWCYFGGIPGALTVVLAAITINSPLKLASSLSLMLTGQVIYGMLSDSLGWFGMTRRSLSYLDLISIVLILAGSGILIVGK